jgi:hypothetical protein
MDYSAAGEPLLRVNNVGGVSYNDAGNISASMDAFGRMRVSNPFTLFDGTQRYRDDEFKWDQVDTGAATCEFLPNESTMLMTVVGNGDSAVRQTKQVFSYQPGKSLLTMMTFAMNTPTLGLRQRVGYFGAQNGFYVQLDGSTLSFVERSSVTGSVVSSPVVQSSWNGDKLDGTGPSGLTLDITKSQILWMDLEWLGVGSVRLGFVINGRFVLCHTFHHANLVASTYITTASLPLRYEITNTGATSGSSTLKQICSTVISEGGYQLNGAQQAAFTPILDPYTLVTAGTYYPVVSLRLKSTRLDAIAVLTALSFLPTEANDYNWQVRAGCTTANGSWGNVDANSSVEYNLTGTSVSGGRILASGFVKSTSTVGPSIDILKEALFRFQLERNTFTTTPSELSFVAATSGSGTVNKDVFASMDWEEISR